jgi:hypothetical protein
MNTFELKSSIHKYIDSIESESVLNSIYDFLKARHKRKSKGVWEKLTEDQKSEILLSWEESEDEANLIDAKKIFKGLK